MPLAGADSIVQVATGSTGGTDASTSFVTFPTPAGAGHTVLITSAFSFVSTVDYVLPDQLTHPAPTELLSYVNSPLGHANTPVVWQHGVYLNVDTASWQFNWINNSSGTPQVTGVAWLAVEIAGLVPLTGSGVDHPWEVNGTGIWFYNDGVTVVADTGDGTFAQSDYEVLSIAAFGAWVPSSRPPAALSFAEGTNTAWGGWTALAPNVRTTNASTPNVGLDVAYKIAYGPGQFDCIATYGQAPTGIGLFKDAWASDVLGAQRVRSSLSAMVMSG